MERLAIVPLDNLTSDSHLEWARRATAAAIAYDLERAPDIWARTVESIDGAYSIRATRVLQGYFVEHGGRLEVHAVVEDLGSRKAVESLQLDGASPDGLLPLVNQLAKKLSGASRPFSTSNQDAFQAYGEALNATDRGAAEKNFEAAIAADPRFAAAYLAWMGVLAGSGNRDQVARASIAMKSVDPLDRAQRDYLLAIVFANPDAQASDLETLTRFAPSDANRWKELAQLQLARRRFPDAVRSYEQAVRADPDDSNSWNELGYAHAFAGDLVGARRSLEHYQSRLAPTEINGLDSLGEVNFFLGDFATAARYFAQAQEKNPAATGELLKEAQARLMAGDLAGADIAFQKYLAPIQRVQPGLAGFEQARWEFLTGRRKAGMSRLEKLLPILTGDSQALGLRQLAIWKLESGDSKQAATLAEQSLARATGPQTRAWSAEAVAIAGGESAAASPITRALALLYAKRFAQAIPMLEGDYRATNPSFDGQIRTLLAWAYVESGRIGDARKLVEIFPLPLNAGDATFASLVFPRNLYVRAVTQQNEGHRRQATSDYRLYLRYSGDLPDIFDDAAKARRNLGTL